MARLRPFFIHSKLYVLTSMILLALFWGAFQASIVQLALPSMTEEFGVDYASLSLVVAAYFLTFSTFSVALGKLGDIYTPKAVFLAGLAVFGSMSWFSAMARSPLLLVTFRALQGVGMGALSANGISLLRLAYPEERRGFVLALWSATVSLGYIIGPGIGGYVVTLAGWRPLFQWTVALHAVLFAVMIFVLPSSGRRKAKFDYLGAILLTVVMLTFMLLVQPPEKGSSGPTHFLLLGGLLGLCVLLFIIEERKSSDPLIDFGMFANRTFQYGLSSGMILAATVQGVNYLLQYYLQQDLGYSASDSGFFWTIMSAATLLATMLLGQRSDRIGSRVLVIYGSVLRFLAFALFFLTVYHPNQATTFLVGTVVVLFGLGMGISSAPVNSLIIGSFPRSETGIVSGIYSMLRTLSSSLGLILFGQLLLFGGRIAQTRLDVSILVAALLTLMGLWAIYRVPRGA